MVETFYNLPCEHPRHTLNATTRTNGETNVKNILEAELVTTGIAIVLTEQPIIAHMTSRSAPYTSLRKPPGI